MSGPNASTFSAGQQIANPTYLVDANGNQITSFGGTGGTAATDDSTYTAGSTSFTPIGGVYNDSIAAATSGKADGARITQNRAVHINIRSNAGTELATASNPLQVSLANTAANTTPLLNQLVDSAGTNVAGVDATHNVLVKVNSALPAGSAVIGSTTIQATSGTALQADQTNTILKTSLYVKTSAAADTVLALGQAAMAASVPVTMANNQTAMPVGVSAGTAFDGNSGTISANSLRTVAGGAATGTKSNVASNASSVTILASNTSRKGAAIYNDSTQILYLDCSGGTASATSYTLQIPANGFFEVPGPNIYNGAITGIWAAANGNARVTEWT